MRIVLVGRDGIRRPLFKAELTKDGSIVISPILGVPALVRSWEVPLVAVMPDVPDLHATIHGSGDVHLRANGSNKDIESLRVPPLRNFASASYFLQIIPQRLDTYAPAAAKRNEDRDIDVSRVDHHGFHAIIAVGILDSETAAHRDAYPGVSPEPPQKAMHLLALREGRLEVQVAIVWLVDNPPPPAKKEIWWLIRYPDGGDHLPRPVGGSLTPLAWKNAERSQLSG